jgi:copper(I)-binding protein
MKMLCCCVLVAFSGFGSEKDPRPLFQNDGAAAIVRDGVAIYATLTNPTMYDAYVDGGTSDAGKVELRDGDKVVSTITIPSFGSIELKAGGPFVLIKDLKGQPKAGDTIKVTLSTDGGAAIPIAAVVKEIKN